MFFAIKDVRAFTERFKQQEVFNTDPVRHLNTRIEMMKEEVDEFDEAYVRGDFPGMIDALIDLIYFAIGTAILLGLTNIAWVRCWSAVHMANMAKIPAPTGDNSDGKKRGALNALKPEGWRPPDLAKILQQEGVKCTESL